MLTETLQRLITDLSESPPVRDYLCVSSAESAAARIYVDGLPEPPVGMDSLGEDQVRLMRPYILIYPAESESFKLESIAAPACVQLTGSVDMVLSCNYPKNKTPNEAWFEIAAKIQKIIQSNDPEKPGLLEYLGQSERLQLKELDVSMYGRTPVSERINYGDAYDVVMTLRY